MTETVAPLNSRVRIGRTEYDVGVGPSELFEGLVGTIVGHNFTDHEDPGWWEYDIVLDDKGSHEWIFYHGEFEVIE